MTNWMQDTFGDSSRPFFDFFSEFGGPTGWLLVVAVVFWVSGSKNGMRVGFATALATITNEMLKWLLAHPRPYYVNDDIQAMKPSSGLGMPSGHAQGVAAQWFAVGYFTKRFWCICLAVIFIVGTGSARVYYGLHSPLQVSAGWGLGILTVVMVALLERPVVAWCRSKPAKVQVASGIAVAAIIVLAGYGISVGIRGDFQPSPEWESRWQATVDRLVAEGDEDASEEELEFIDSSNSLLFGASFLGYALCGIGLLRIGEINPTSPAHRVVNVVFGVPLLVTLVVVVLFLLSEFIGELPANIILLLVFPTLVGIILPKFTSRFFIFGD